MPVVSGTPESALPRSDSRNPATTCKGLTSNGRPCRRALASSKNGSDGVLAMLPHVGHARESAAAYYCWQHKDQASHLVDDSGQILELKQRSSIDTLMEKLGVLDVEDGKGDSKNSKQSSIQKSSIPPQWASIPGPLMSVPENYPVPASKTAATRKPRPVHRTRERVHVSFFCCMRASEDERLPPARPRSTPVSTRKAASSYRTSTQAMPNSLEDRLSFIPQTLSPTIRTVLMSELSRPLTASDHEPGYIYIFWLTPKDVPKDVAYAASSLFVQTDQTLTPRNGRRTSEVLRDFNQSNVTETLNTSRTIMLKIGRASNVHRRMVQWSRQCGHHITLLRYYPHQDKRSSLSQSPKPSSNTASRSPTTIENVSSRDHVRSPLQKTPFIPRVERLIHLELTDKQIKRNCEGCGKEHREWFEIDATRQGIGEVDAVVRRWISWAQQRSS